MHSAFLQHADGCWTLSDSYDAVVDHTGAMLINEDQEDQTLNLEVLAAQEGKEASLKGRKVVFTASKLHGREEDALGEVRAVGEALVSYVYGFQNEQLPNTAKRPCRYGIREDRSYWSEEEREKERVKWLGVVSESTEDGFVRLFEDVDLYERLLEARRRRHRREARNVQRRLPRRDDFQVLANTLSNAIGAGYIKSFRIEQLWTWLAAHDAAHGRRATNREALSVARQWCNDRKKSKKWLNRWASEEVVELTDKRLAAVLRLGDRNSRHKAS